jgi:hypothetical protein
MWEDNIKVDFKAVRWEDVDWVHLCHDRVQQGAYVNTALTFCVP